MKVWVAESQLVRSAAVKLAATMRQSLRDCTTPEEKLETPMQRRKFSIQTSLLLSAPVAAGDVKFSAAIGRKSLESVMDGDWG
jgi:hypothetical protein